MARYRWAAAGAALAIAGTVLAPGGPAWADTIRDRQWHLATLRVAQAQRISTGAGVIVAVIDTGVQADHPDLAGHVLPGIRLHGDPDDRGQFDPANHGTGVAGLIAAQGKGSGALGIAPGAMILPVAVATGGLGGYDDIPAAIRWAVDHHARVINLSVQSNEITRAEVEAVRYALAHDVVLVAAAGNLSNGGDQLGAPAGIAGVLAVTATNRDGHLWSGSVHGPNVGLAAPGVNIVTLANHQTTGGPGGYVRVPGGTSAAAPLVAGAAALIRAKYPNLSAPDVINRLIRTADPAGPPGRDDQYGFGELNIVRALTAEVAAVPANPLGQPSDPPPRRAAAGSPAGFPVALLAGAGVLGLLVVAGVVVFVVLLHRRRA